LIPSIPIWASATGGGATLHLLPDLSTLIRSLILFAIVFGILWKFAWKQILHALEEREHRIKKEISDAEEARRQSEARLAEYEQKLADARKEASAILEASRAEADRQRETLLTQTRKETEQMTERARREIQIAEQKAVAELRKKTVEFSTQIAGKILERAIGPEEHRTLAESYLSELERTEAGRR
jgi:F-type H+-transporting ATPase subunit b